MQNDIKLKNSWLRIVSSILFVGAILFINGFLTLLEYNFDFSTIQTLEFWVLYLINILSASLIFVVVYYLRKYSNIKNERVIKRIRRVFSFTDAIYTNGQVKPVENWLKTYYNEHLRLDKLEQKTRFWIRVIILKEPAEIKNTFWNKVLLRYPIYKLKKRTHKIREKRRDDLLERLALIEKARENLEKQVKGEKTTPITNKKFNSALKRIWIRKVTFYTLSANEFGYDNQKHETPFSNERVNLLVSLLWGLLLGLIITVIFFSFKDINPRAITHEETLLLVVKGLTFLGYTIRALFTADNFVFSKYTTVLDTRLKILSQANNDLKFKELKDTNIEELAEKVAKQFELSGE